MSKETINSVKLGAFVIVATLLFITGAYFIGNKQGMFKSKFQVSAYFNNVNGLRKGSSVRYAGITVGSVKDVVIINDTTLRIDMLLEEKVQSFIKKNATASISSDGLVAGDMIVNIIPGEGNAPTVENNDFIASFARIDANDLLKSLGNTNDNIALLSLNLLEITDRLNHGNGTIPLLIRDSLMAADLRSSLENLRLTTAYAAQTTRQLQQSLEKLARPEGNLGRLLHDTTLMFQMENLALGLDTLFLQQTEPFIHNLNKAGEDIAATSDLLKNLLDDFDQSKGLAHTLMRDSMAARDLKEILQNLDEGTARFSENMEALQHNFLFRRYFKKQEKERKRALEKVDKDNKSGKNSS